MLTGISPGVEKNYKSPLPKTGAEDVKTTLLKTRVSEVEGASSVGSSPGSKAQEGTVDTSGVRRSRMILRRSPVGSQVRSEAVQAKETVSPQQKHDLDRRAMHELADEFRQELRAAEWRREREKEDMERKEEARHKEMLRAFDERLELCRREEQRRAQVHMQEVLEDMARRRQHEQQADQEKYRELVEEVQTLRSLRSGGSKREEMARLIPKPESVSVLRDETRPDRAVRTLLREPGRDLPGLEKSRLDPLDRVSARDFRPGEQFFSDLWHREKFDPDLGVRAQLSGEFLRGQDFDRGGESQDKQRLDGDYGAHDQREVKPGGWRTVQDLHAPTHSSVSDRAWKTAQADCDKATTAVIRPSANLWDATWDTLNNTVVGPVVASVLQSPGQDWNLVMCLTDSVNLIMASMLGWAVPFSSKSGRVQTPAGQWNEAFLRLQIQSLDQDEIVVASARDYLGSQGMADDALLRNKIFRKIKAAQGALVQMLLNLTSDAISMPKLGMRTPRQHVERAAQAAAQERDVQVTPHQVLVVIMECAKQGKKDAARIRKDAMQQLLAKKICKDPQGMLESLQTFEDLKRSYLAEFAMPLPEDFEEDLLRQQQENSKGSERADMRALLRKIFEASSNGDKVMNLSELIKRCKCLSRALQNWVVPKARRCR